MSRSRHKEDAQTRELLREVEARWRAMERLTAWAALSSARRGVIIDELERLDREAEMPGCGAAADALDAVPAVVETEAIGQARTDIVRLVAALYALLDRR